MPRGTLQQFACSCARVSMHTLRGAAHTAARKKGCPDKTQYRVAH
nr:MAG TPA: hypothetical protein [Caudoviricetes sp.]